MLKRRSIFLILCTAVLTVAAPVFGASGYVYLVNATQGGPTIYGACESRSIVSAAGEHSACYLSTTETFHVGLMAKSLVPIAVDQEGGFEASLPGGEKIRGTLETVIHLSPNIYSYYVYFWQVVEPVK